MENNHPRIGFLRTTLIGGVLYLVPIVVLVAIFGKALHLTKEFASPAVKAIEATGLGHILTPQVVGILFLLLFCLAAGWFATSALGQRISLAINSKLGNVPGYTLYKSVGESLAGVEPPVHHQPVMAWIEESWQIAMIVDELEDGLLAVYVPSVPEPRTGSLYFMKPERVRPLSISMKEAMHVLRSMGVDSRKALAGVNLRE